MSKKDRLFLSAGSTELHICDSQMYKITSEQKKKIIQKYVHGHLLSTPSRVSCYRQARHSLWTEARGEESEL